VEVCWLCYYQIQLLLSRGARLTPLLLIGNERGDDKAYHSSCENNIGNIESIIPDAGSYQQDVGRRCNDVKKDLEGVSGRSKSVLNCKLTL